MLKRVVFPAPFGPIKPVIVPSLTSRVQSFTALTPPKLFFIFFILSIRVYFPPLRTQIYSILFFIDQYIFYIFFGIILFGFFMALLSFEIALRIFPLHPINLKELHPYLGSFNIPYREGWFFLIGCDEFLTYIKINSKGLRDVEHSYEKPPDRKRILLLGDSFIEGLQVDLEKILARRLERKLSEKGYDVEVINAGMSGYGTDQEVLFYELEGYKYDPDIVILFLLVGNDLTDVLNKKLKPYFEMENETLVIKNYPTSYTQSSFYKVKEFIRKNILYHFRTWFFLTDTLNIIIRGKYLGKKRDRFEVYKNDYSYSWRIVELLVLRLRRELEEKNKTLIFVYIPSDVELINNVTDLNLSEHRVRFLNFCKNENLSCIDLFPYLKKYYRETSIFPYFTKCDRHWNEYGHEIAAEIIKDYLIENQYL